MGKQAGASRGRGTVAAGPRRHGAAVAGIAADAADLADRVERVLWELRLTEPLQGDLEGLQDGITTLLHSAPDVVTQQFRCRGGLGGVVIYERGTVDQGLLVRGVLDRLADADLGPDDGAGPDLLARVSEHVAPTGAVTRAATLGKVTEELFEGSALVAFSGCRQALAIKIEKLQTRAIGTSKQEPVVMGPQESFIEDAGTNLTLVRRRLRTARLWIDQHRVGTVSRTGVYVLHLHGIADDRIVAEVLRRLRTVRMDGVVDMNQIKEQIRDTPRSPFPTAQRTERPDRVAAALLEGRVALIVDGSPFAMIVPFTLPGMMTAAEDYYLHWTVASATRVVRWLALFLGLFLPAFYVAVATYHQEFIPMALLITLASARENVPLPSLAEVLILLVIFEIIREASVRTPLGIGNALTIGGTLVVGQAAVRAGIISSPIIIVTSAVAIAFFAIPNYELVQVSRLVLYPVLFAAGLLGIYGVFFVLIVLAVHLASLRSFGVPYTEPIAPLRPADWKDFIVREPWYEMRTRPFSVGGPNPVRKGRASMQHPPRRRP